MDSDIVARAVMVVAVALQVVVIVHTRRRRPNPDRGFVLRVQAAAVAAWVVALVLVGLDR